MPHSSSNVVRFFIELNISVSNRLISLVDSVSLDYARDASGFNTVSDSESLDATREAIAGRAPDACGVAVTTHQRDISWDCNSEEAALSLSQKLQQVPNVTVEIAEIED